MTSGSSAHGLTWELADMAVSWEHPVPSAAHDLVERAVIDTVGVALAAANDPAVDVLLEVMTDDLSTGPSTVWVRPIRTGSRQAALLNGVSAHALDFDDVDEAIIGHPSAVLVPAVLAEGEALGVSGKAIVTAYWAGLVVARAAGRALDINSHYGAGWHSTGTLGALAAAAAGARLRELSHTQTRHALGIAGSLAAGSRQNFGTMTKPLHAGVAAANGLMAAKLAGSGFTADPGQLEGPFGFLALHHAAPGTRRATQAELAQSSLNVKLHACCYYIHAAADAMLELGAAGISPADVTRITVTGPPNGFDALIHHQPHTGLEGKFSMEYAMAACLLDGALGFAGFTDEAVDRDEAQELLRKVELRIEEVPPIGPAEWDWGYAVVAVTLNDGRRLENRVDKPRGNALRPLTDHELRMKFDDCLVHGGFLPSADLFESLRSLHELESIRDAVQGITQLTGAAGTVPPDSEHERVLPNRERVAQR